MATTYTQSHAVSYDNGPYVASAICPCHPGRHSLFVVYAGGHRIDWPIRWPNGTIAYDWPERVPKTAKRLVEQSFSALR